MKALAAIAIGCFGIGYGVGWMCSKAHDMTGFIPVLPRGL
jgi:hypothetical protein